MKLYHGTNVNFELIRDKENELHIQSSAYNYELFKKEYLTATSTSYPASTPPWNIPAPKAENAC